MAIGDNSNTGSGGADKWQTALGGQSSTEEPLSSASDEFEDVARAEESTVDGQESPGESKDTQEDSTESQALTGASKKPEAKQGTSDKEVIAVTDETGRKRKVEIDYSNRDSIKKAFAAAAGMRKFQAERDQAIQAGKARDGEFTELKSNWDNLEKAYQGGGVEGLIDLLEGRKGAFTDYLSRTMQKRDFLKNASPEEIEAMNFREEAEKNKRELDKIRKDNNEFKAKVTEEREQAEYRETQSKVNPVFDKYRFADKLGDKQDEQMFDEMLWNTTLERLKPYEQQGVDLSAELIDREFRQVASAIRKRINVQADKKVSKVVEQKKQEATENIQSKVRAGYNKSSDEEKLRGHLKSGNTDAIFKNWSSFRGILGNKK